MLVTNIKSDHFCRDCTMCPRRLRQSVGPSLQKGLPVSLCLCKLMFVVLEKHLAYNTLAADWLKNIWKHVCEPPVRQNSVQIIKYCHLARLFSTAWCIYLLGWDSLYIRRHVDAFGIRLMVFFPHNFFCILSRSLIWYL